MPNTVRAKKDGLVTTAIINQPEVKSACKVGAVHKLYIAFQTFDTEPDAKIAMQKGPTVRRPRLIGQSQAIDIMLTARVAVADKAYHIGLTNRLVLKGEARHTAE